MSFDPTCLSLNVALAKRADRDRIRQLVENVRPDGHQRDQFFRHLDDLLDEISSARGHAGRAVFQAWSYAYALGLLNDDRALEYLLHIHNIGGGTGKCNIEELGKALDAHVHRVGFSLINKIWPNRRVVAKNSEIIVLNNLNYDVRCPEVFHLLDSAEDLLDDRRRARGNRIELMQLRRRLKFALQSLYSHDVFVCHASKDKQRFVEPFVKALQAQGISCWYDTERLFVGDDIAQSIREGLNESLFVAVVISKDAEQSIWVRREVADAFSKVAAERRECFLPIVLDEDARVPFEMSPVRSVFPMRDGFERTFEEIVTKISRYTLA